MIITDNLDYMVEHLTKPEVNKLKKMVLGYGNFKKTARKSGLPETTFRYILNNGYGMPHNVQKIRTNIFGYPQQSVA